MAFNLFKKQETADVLFKNGLIYTMDPELPLVESLACRDGLIIALGDEKTVAAYQNSDTESIDLKGNAMLPGFIQMHGTQVDQAFEGSFVELFETMTPDDLLKTLRAFVKQHPKEEHYFAYGYNEKKIDENSLPEFRQTLEEICATKPVILIAADGFHMVLNTTAGAMVYARAQELGIDTLTPQFVIDTLVSVDYEDITRNVMKDLFSSAQKGYTSVFDKASFSSFDNAYRDILVDAFQNDFLKQRYFGAFLLNRPFPERLVTHSMAQKRTACAELDQKINMDMLHIVCSGNEESVHYMSSEYLSRICGTAADKGYGIRIAALDKDAALTALDLLGALQASYKKLSFSLEYSQDLPEEELSHIFTGNVPVFSPASAMGPSGNPGDAVYALTVQAAEYMGLSALCGKLEKGKWADFTVLSEDPFHAAPGTELQDLKVLMTFVSGQIAYDSTKDSAAQWINRMLEQLNYLKEDLSL